MLLKKFFMDLQTLSKCIGLYGGLNTSRIKFSPVTNYTQKRENFSPLNYDRLSTILGALTSNSASNSVKEGPTNFQFSPSALSEFINFLGWDRLST